MYVDSSVFNHQIYFYALQTVDLSFENERSKLSVILSVAPNEPPFIDTLIVKNTTQLEVYFSEPMDPDVFKAKNFILRSIDNPTTSAISFLNGQAVLLSFSNELVKDVTYQLEMIALRDSTRTPLPAEESVYQFTYRYDISAKPYVSEWQFENQHSLVLTFSVPMNSNTASNVSNYTLEPSGSVESIESVESSKQKYLLRLSKDTYGLGSGVTTYITLNNIESEQGVTLDDGNRIALISTTMTIDNLLVYPQPAAVEDGWLMFSNIAKGTFIRIFDINGHFVTALEELDQNGGVRWDFRDQAGNRVASGIYIYQATFDNQTKLGKFTIIK